MRLSAENVDLYYKLMNALLYFTNIKLSILENLQTPEDIRRIPLDEKVRLREALWKNADLIDAFTAENPFHFSDEEIEIVRGWKHFVQGRFVLLSHQKKYTVFFDEKNQLGFGVLALTDDFQEMLGPRLPILVDTVLLPFKGEIIYDGLLSSYNLFFGRGIRERLKAAYQEAKAKHGIVTSLPFAVESKRVSDEDLLRYYLKNKRNREEHWEDIWLLLRKKPALHLLFHQEMGKIHSRSLKKKLREIGIEKGAFAILEGMIVAGGRNPEETLRVAKQIVPSEKRAWLYVFQVGD